MVHASDVFLCSWLAIYYRGSVILPPSHLNSYFVILQVMPLDVATVLWRASVPVSSLFNVYDMMNQDIPSSQPTRKLRRLEVTVQCLRWMGEGNQVRYWLDYFWWGFVTALLTALFAFVGLI